MFVHPAKGDLMTRYTIEKHVIYRFEEALDTGVVFHAHRKKAMMITVFTCMVLSLLDNTALSPGEISYRTGIESSEVEKIIEILVREHYVKPL
ncbi:hypothetical protein CR163_006550 [Prosthecochloris sp. ZM_2]|nr:hypothetical protein CR163_006550 [Prosthecochloris sp. ZM_2]